MKKKLRSYVEPGSVRWAMRLAEWGVMGITENDMDKPKIAVVNASSKLAACFSHLDDIAERMCDEIKAAGGLPFEIRTAVSSDAVTSMGRRGGYILPTRDLIVNDVEVAVEGAMLDGMVCLVSCDKTVPGLLMAAARINIPTIVVACGYQPSGEYKGELMDFEELWFNAARRQAGEVNYSIEEMTEMSKNAILGPGVCSGMGTANSMHIVCEALGMVLPGSTPVLANSKPMWDTVTKAATRIIDMVWEDLKPRDILTREAFANAAKVAMAVSGSINTVKHLQALAAEAELDVDVYRMYEKYADDIPLLSAIRPNGDYSIEQFEAAGGTRAVMKQLESLLDTNALTVTGKTVKENLHEIVVANEEAIRPVDNAFNYRPSIVLLRGSLAPDTGIVKLSVTEERDNTFSGPAIVFESTEEAIEGVEQGKVKPGDVVALRGLGPKGTPGMGLLTNFIFALNGAGLGGKVAVVTDGQQSGLANRGIVVAEIAPEAALGGPLGLVEKGDRITIDITNRFVNLEVSEEELEARRSRLKDAPMSTEKGWLYLYQQNVRPMPQTGGILINNK